MSNNLKERILLVGTGYMGKEYAKVLQGQGREFLTIGRGEKNAAAFEAATGAKALCGGLEQNLSMMSAEEIPDHAIVAVNYAELEKATALLMERGVRHILLEKPGAPTYEGISRLQHLAREKGAEVSLAYNRRYYASSLEAEKIIAEDGGVVSFCFEFTELPRIAAGLKDLADAYGYFFGNSSHVIDLAFHLGGKPQQMSCYRQGLAFAGAGLTAEGASFSYQANWQAPGRWGVEIITRQHRLIFRPLEKLQVQALGSMQIAFVEIDDKLDQEYKPGLYKEVEAFMAGGPGGERMCSLDEQAVDAGLYKKISCDLASGQENGTVETL